ncbi:MAG: phosphotransferase, partial [Muribaculaceae bacterium]|nr:phosphotransferase [Muribaculaceae bacterium]
IVDICSFSYKQGMPRYRSQHGGGFIFDCRAPHNPGRYDQYKKLTGLDPEVKEFLDRYGEMRSLVDHAEAMVGAAVQRYLERGFDSLSVGFGCTGGRHRSVYGAEMLAKRLNEKYGVEVRVNHTNLGISYKLPSRE